VTQRPATRGIICYIAFAVSLLLSGCSGESDVQVVSGSTDGSSTASPPDGTEEPTADPPVVMPDYIGTPYDVAEAELAQYNVRLTRRARVSAEPPGAVVDQDPPGGAPFAQSVVLTVSVEPPPVPDVVDKTFGDAQQELERLGFAIVEVPEFDDEKVDGLVVGQDPPAGTTNAGEVRVTVVRRPVVSYLAEEEPVSREIGYRTGTAKANGATYSYGLVLKAPYDGVGAIEYDLSRHFRKLVGEVGLDDAASSDAIYRVEIYGDNRALWSDTVSLGTTTPIAVDVTDVLRLRIAVSRPEGSGEVVLGDLRVQGLRSEVTPTPTPQG
jgi:hypothetical protein